MNRMLNIGVAQKIGTYSDGVEAPASAKWVFTAGTPGLMPDGTYPRGVAAQAEQAWENVLAILADAGMGVKDLVKVTHYLDLVRQEDIKDYVAVRALPRRCTSGFDAARRAGNRDAGDPRRDRVHRHESVRCYGVHPTRLTPIASPCTHSNYSKEWFKTSR